MAPKQMCQIFQALLMLQLKPSSMPLFVQPPALLHMCKQVSECVCFCHKLTPAVMLMPHSCMEGAYAAVDKTS